MTENREQSQPEVEWYDAQDVIMGSELGPYRLTVRTPNHVEDDEGVYHASQGHLTLVNKETDEVLLDIGVTPVMGPEFTTWDQQFWYVTAEDAIADSGADLEALIAQGRLDNAA